LLRNAFPENYSDAASTPIGVEIPPGGKNLDPFVVGK
jgi:hypothetical protein